jgi:hypothetical protein
LNRVRTLYPSVLFKLSIVTHVIVSSLLPVYVDILAKCITPKMDVGVLFIRLIGLASDQLWLICIHLYYLRRPRYLQPLKNLQLKLVDCFVLFTDMSVVQGILCRRLNLKLAGPRNIHHFLFIEPRVERTHSFAELRSLLIHNVLNIDLLPRRLIDTGS